MLGKVKIPTSYLLGFFAHLIVCNTYFYKKYKNFYKKRGVLYVDVEILIKTPEIE